MLIPLAALALLPAVSRGVESNSRRLEAYLDSRRDWIPRSDPDELPIGLTQAERKAMNASPRGLRRRASSDPPDTPRAVPEFSAMVYLRSGSVPPDGLPARAVCAPVSRGGSFSFVLATVRSL